MNTRYARFLIPVLVLFALSVRTTAAEWTPKAVYPASPVVASEDDRFSVDKMLDGTAKTFAAFPAGDGTKKDPIAEFVLDLGEKRSTQGVRFASPSGWKTYSPKKVDVFACDDPGGRTNIRVLKAGETLPAKNRLYSACVVWEPVETRYLGVRIHEGWYIVFPEGGTQQPRKAPPSAKFPPEVRIAEIRVLEQRPDDTGLANPEDTAFPVGRLHLDWIMQDHGLKTGECFSSRKNSAVEEKMFAKILGELKDADLRADVRHGMEELLAEKRPGADPAWKRLYLRACEARRRERLSYVLAKTDRIVYAKHYVIGGTAGLSGIPLASDEQFFDRTPELRPGSQLCLIALQPDGTVRHEVLLDKPDGVIRDPNLSYDGRTLVFAMRDSFHTDDYHLYTMKLDDRSVKQITFSPEADGVKYPCSDFEPCFMPSGGIVFASNRNVQIDDCWPNGNTNLFSCDAEGRSIRRLTYDELDVNYPQVLEDGRILFTRWEYNDRNAYFLHPLFTMNPDGTAQTEYCGNNSMFPASYLQSRAIPGSGKVVSIISGHHVVHKGKLALVDRNLGTQDGRGIEFVAGSAPDGTPGRQRSTIRTTGFHDRKIDYFGQKGPQYQYPYAFDEEHYLVAFCPEGWDSLRGPYNPPMGIYFMSVDGERELLAFDWTISSGHPVPVLARTPPPVKPDQADLAGNFGTFVVQDVYIGPGLKDIPRGAAKRLRVVALEYRAAKIGQGTNAGEADRGIIQTPVAFNNGTWDVKHVLGEVDIEEDGSVAFDVPARTPVYFQILDEKGHCIQTMRSWATLQGGETFACLGCHEDKNETTIMPVGRTATRALRKSPQKLQPLGNKPHPLMTRLEKESCLDSIENYWTINAPPLTVEPDGPVEGFSYLREIQPILDRHCTACHAESARREDGTAYSTLFLTGDVVHRENDVDYKNYKRAFTRSYLELTNDGKVENSRYVRWLEVRSRSEILPPYHTGSCQSSLMAYLEPDHYGVKVSDTEKRTIACWIDLLIPFCGSYPEANTWTEKERAEYLYYIKKRRFFAERELEDVRGLSARDGASGRAAH